MEELHTPLHVAVSGTGKMRAAVFLVAHGADLEVQSKAGYTPLQVGA